MEKAEVLNNFFSSVFTTEDTDNMPEFKSQTEVTLNEVTITVKMMKDKLQSLKTSKSQGPDGIHPRLLKELAEELSTPLKILFDKTMKEKKIPDDWKTAEVKPIF